MATASPELRPFLGATSPLFNHSFGCAFAASPLSTHGSHDDVALTSAVSAAFPLTAKPAIKCDTSAAPISHPALASKPISRSSTSSSSSPQLGAIGGFEPLTFEKLPIAVPSAGSTITAASTDSEMVSDSCCGSGGGLSRSPSLLTSLIQSQQRSSRFPSRQSSLTASSRCAPATPVTPPGSSSGARPILRRASMSATSDDGWMSSAAPMPASRAGHPGLGLVAVPELGSVPEPAAEKTTELSTTSHPDAAIKTLGQRRRSCLTFAVTPSRRSPSPASSKPFTGSSPPTRLPSLADDEEFLTDSDDAGYQEDEEDGFDSDNEVADRSGAMGAGPSSLYVACPGPSRRRASSVSWPTEWAPPILRTPTSRRRQTAPIEWQESTDDADEMHPNANARPSRRRVRVVDDSMSNDRCSRHRSPPPTSSSRLAPEPAPPAARSPSAFDLCRRRDSSRHHEPAGRFRSNVHPSGSRSDAPTYALRGSAISISASSNNNGAGNHILRVPSTRAQQPCGNDVKPIPILQNSTQPSSSSMRRDSVAFPGGVQQVSPTSAIEGAKVTRRGSAPARVDHVLAFSKMSPCNTVPLPADVEKAEEVLRALGRRGSR